MDIPPGHAEAGEAVVAEGMGEAVLAGALGVVRVGFEKGGGDIVAAGDEAVVAAGRACGIDLDRADDIIFFDEDAAVVPFVADELVDSTIAGPGGGNGTGRCGGAVVKISGEGVV